MFTNTVKKETAFPEELVVTSLMDNVNHVTFVALFALEGIKIMAQANYNKRNHFLLIWL